MALMTDAVPTFLPNCKDILGCLQFICEGFVDSQADVSYRGNTFTSKTLISLSNLGVQIVSIPNNLSY